MSVLTTIWYVAQCDECLSQPDLDGEEYKPNAEDAEDVALSGCMWQKTDDGRLLCDECRPQPF